MIEFLLITALILALYTKTWKYKYLIDDQVPRGGYLYVVTMDKYDKNFYEQTKPILATLTNIGVFLATCLAIQAVWGWKAALLYAVMPLNVSGVAWNTGNYYMTTVLFIVVTYFLTTFGMLGTALGISFYVAALGSTVSAIPFAFLLPLLDHHWWDYSMIVPLLFYLFGKRFQTGLKRRAEKHKDIHVKTGHFDIKNLIVMTKVTAYYIYLSLWPSKLGFFHELCKDEIQKGEVKKTNQFFWLSLALIVSFFVLGWMINPQATLWWFAFIGIFSQFTTFGQFVSERYTYIANVGFCVLLASSIDGSLYAVVATLWFCRSWIYIPAWKNNKQLFIESAFAFPKAPENYNNLASYYIDWGQWWKAAEALLMSLKYSSDKESFNVNSNLAYCYAQCASFDKALHYSRMAMIQCPQSKSEALHRQIRDLEERVKRVRNNQKLLKQRGII